jgi:hypothetical protein
MGLRTTEHLNDPCQHPVGATAHVSTGSAEPSPQGRHRDAVLLGHGGDQNARLAALLNEPGLEGRAVAPAPAA